MAAFAAVALVVAAIGSLTLGAVHVLLSDVPTADYPWRYLIREMLHEGTFPSWNPYVFSGIPLWSNPQTGLFSIFSLPLWILLYALGLVVPMPMLP